MKDGLGSQILQIQMWVYGPPLSLVLLGEGIGWTGTSDAAPCGLGCAAAAR